MSNYGKSWYKNKRPQSSKQFNEDEVSFIENLETFGYYGFRLYFPEASKDFKIILYIFVN